MSLLALEINDCGIIAARENSIMLDSPGIALLDEGEPLVGEPAARRAFLSPSQANNRFWDELAKSPLPRPFGSARTHADLVYAHLRQIWNKLKPGIDGVILAVPGFYDRRQLELLLGISNAIDLPVIGLVDAAVAAGRGAGAKRTAAHLELHLHCVALTRLRLDSEVSHAGTETSREVGMASLASTWVKALARRFVRETRFDPLHYGATEQALHDQLPDVLASLGAQPGAELSVARGKRRFKISVSREEFKADAEHLYARLGALVAPHVASRSPGSLAIRAETRSSGGLRLATWGATRAPKRA